MEGSARRGGLTIRWQKKIARQRNCGHNLDTDTYEYMVRILQLIKEGFPSSEEKAIFVNNVYEQATGREIEYAQNRTGSLVLDLLLKYATLEAIKKLLDAFSDSLRLLSSDRFASHVLQKLIIVCADRGNKSTSSRENSQAQDSEQDLVINVTDEEVVHYNETALKLSKYFLNNIQEFILDKYANHLLRTVFECLGGLIDKPDFEPGKKKPTLDDIERRQVIQDYKDLLLKTCERLLKWPQFLEYGKDELTSGLLQSILYSLKDIDADLMSKYVTKITTECFKPGKDGELSNVFSTESSMRLLEVCLLMSEPKTFTPIYDSFFVNNLKELSLKNGTNFSVQKLLDKCATKEDLERIYDEISKHFSDILMSGFTGVLVSVANACLRVQAKQGAFVTDMLKMLNCDESEKKRFQIAICIASLTKSENLKVNNMKVETLDITLHGSLIVQAILKFNKPIKIVNSLLEMHTENLVDLLCDPKGSHIADCFVESKYIGEKSREKLARRLQSCWTTMALSAHGSRCLEKMWQHMQQKQKFHVMDELAAAGQLLRSTQSGSIITFKLNVPLYARSRKEWVEVQGKLEKTKALFADIIGNTSTS